ncbi:MAG: PP2C family protein-serine/threonine phosphatase [Gemmataceae bacterium]
MMRELSRYSDPHELYQVFQRRMSQLFPTDRELTLSRRGLQSPDFRVTRYNLWPEHAIPFTQWDRFPVLHGGLFSSLVYGDEPRLINELYLDDDDPAAEFLDGQRSLLSIPIYDQGQATTNIVVTREAPNAFPPEQVPELVWMTNLFGRATQSLVLKSALQDAYESADAELRAVAELQHSLLPSSAPVIPGLDIAVHYRAMGRAGGDYYDYFPLEDGRLGVLVADVSGHGTHAAVLMAITHSIAHSHNTPPSDPGSFLEYLNEQLTRRYSRATGSFVTAFYAVFDPKRRTVRYASAGHVPPRLVRCSEGTLLPMNKAQRLPLGVGEPTTRYPVQTIDFLPGDQVVLTTDGVIEAVNRSGDVFGSERLDAIIACCPRTADDAVQTVLQELARFQDHCPATDDRTIVIVHHSGDV